MPLLNDEPTLNDRLQRDALVAEVAGAITTCQPPQVFGVHGDWGLGKTSFLQQVQWCLVGECPQQTDGELKSAGTNTSKGKYKNQVAVVWFEAWRYQNDDAPVVALLQEIRSQLSWGTKLRQQVNKIGEVAIRGALLSLEDVTKKIGIQTSKIQEAGERWEKDNLATTLPSHTIREHLKESIDKLLPPAKSKSYQPRLVVLIDDLDRCDPDSAYRLLEGLKIYLTLRNCVFVLGMNQKIIEDAIAKKMPGQKDQPEKPPLGASRAAAYLEKLCQNVWRLPMVRNPKKLLYDWLSETGVFRDWIDAAIGEHRCLPPNPRRLKGFANLLQRLTSWHWERHRVKAAGDADMIRQAKLMLVVAYIYQFHNDLFLRWEADPELWSFLVKWSRNVATEGDFISGLKRARIIVVDEKTTTPTYSNESAYPDPTESNVLWIQSLIHELGDSVKPDEFIHYLHGTRDAAANAN